MADLKISQLTPATTPLAGTEVLPIVQSGSTVKATIANVQAAPIAALAADSVLFTNASKVPSTNVKLTYDGTLLNTGSTGATGLHFRVRAQGAMARFDTGAASDGRIEYAYNGTDMFYLGINSATEYRLWGRTGTTVLIGAGNATRVEVQSGGDVKVNTGNLIQGTAAKGVNFTANTPAAGMTSQLLNWYEEGTFTAGLTCGSGSVTLDAAFNTLAYTRIGRQVTITGYLKVDTVSSPSGALTLTGLPFTIKNANSAYPTGIPFMTLTGAITGTPVMLGYANTTTVSFRRMSGGTAIDDLAGVLGAGSQIIFTFVYIV